MPMPTDAREGGAGLRLGPRTLGAGVGMTQWTMHRVTPDRIAIQTAIIFHPHGEGPM